MPKDNLTIPIAELRRRIEFINSTFLPLLSNSSSFQAIRDDRKSQIITGINKAYGQAAAYVHEAQLMQSQLNKGRTVITQTHGDVTSGTADVLFAKTTECKVVTDAQASAVDAQIKKALSQLAGERQGTFAGREKDVRIIDLVIDCDTNPWPARTTGSYSVARPSASKKEIETGAKSRLVDQFNAVTAQGLKDWLCGEVNERNAALSMDPRHPKSTRPIHVYHGANGQLAAHTIRCLTIKIRYGTAFYLKKDSYYDSNGFGTGHFLDELVFQIYRKSGVPTLNALTIECVKTKVREAPHVTQASSSPTDGMDTDFLFPEIGV